MISPPEAQRFRGLKQWGEHKNLAESKSSSPRRRSPSPTGKVDRAQPGTDEGESALPKNRAGMNGKARRGGYQPPERYVA